MSEWRQDPLSGRWVIVAPERGRRPFEVKGAPCREHSVSTCPFCPGHEAWTPAETFAIRPHGPANGPGWQVRVVPNKFPAVGHTTPLPPDGALWRRAPATGAHEIVIESPEHDQQLVKMPLDQLERVLEAYRARLEAWLARAEVAYVQLFKNQGVAAGASLSHVHAQLIALSCLPPALAAELRRSAAHHRRRGRCLTCELVARELEEGVRIVQADEHFVALTPFAARLPFELWLLPRAHGADFSALGPARRAALAEALQALLRRLEAIVPDAPHNLALHTAPRPAHDPSGRAQAAYHWRLEVLPRLTVPGGFEWSSGVWINPLPPEAAAARLREAV